MCSGDAGKFWCDLANTIVDKGIIGLAIVLVGFYISRAIERFKSEQSLRAAVAQKELDNIADVWQKMATWEADIDAAIEEYQKAVATTPKSGLTTIQNDFGRRIAALLIQGDDVRILNRKTRFWTGEVYCFFHDYYEKLCAELRSIVPSREETSKLVQLHLNGNRLEATTILERLLDRSHRSAASTVVSEPDLAESSAGTSRDDGAASVNA